MDFETVLRHRRMVRSFDDRPLAAPVVERLLLRARRGPSAGFTQGFELLVLEGPAQTGRFWDASLPEERRRSFRWAGILRAPLLVVFYAHQAAYVARYSEPDKAGPVFAVPWWTVDTSFAAMLLLLAAVNEGLGALFFGVFRPEAVRSAFGVPDAFAAIGAVAVGHPADDRPSTSVARGHRPAGEVVHRGTW